MLPILVAVMVGQMLPIDRPPPLQLGGYAFFEFAPPSEANMGSVCACTTPTGAKGETITFTRASSGMCSKQGLAATGIANGDLVLCSTNQPRVERGVTGRLRLRVERAVTNFAKYSEQFDNAVWVGDAIGVAVPTVRDAGAIAPDGTATAEQVDFPATTAVQHSTIYQTHGDTSGTHASCVFVKGVPLSDGGVVTGSMDVCNGNATFGCTTCSYTSESWTRCKDTRSSISGGLLYIGNFSDSNGGIARSANSVYLWGATVEAGADYCTSYIQTTSAAVARSRDVATSSLASGIYSYAATVEVPYSTGVLGPVIMRIDDGTGTNYMSSYWLGTNKVEATAAQTGALVSSNIQSAVQTLPGTTHRIAHWRNPNTTHALVVAGTESPLTDGRSTFTITLMRLGAWITAGAELDGLIGEVVADPNPTRAR